MTVTTNPDPITATGSSADLLCTVEFDPAVVGTNLSLLMVDVQLSRDGTTLALTGQTMTGTRFTYSSRITSFKMNNVGDYICTATVSLRSAQTYITGNATITGRATFEIGKHIILVLFYNVSNTNWTSFGWLVSSKVSAHHYWVKFKSADQETKGRLGGKFSSTILVM